MVVWHRKPRLLRRRQVPIKGYAVPEVGAGWESAAWDAARGMAGDPVRDLSAEPGPGTRARAGTVFPGGGVCTDVDVCGGREGEGCFCRVPVLLIFYPALSALIFVPFCLALLSSSLL